MIQELSNQDKVENGHVAILIYHLTEAKPWENHIQASTQWMPKLS